MIGVYSKGRLGNQLFAFAFAYVASKRLNTSFFIYKSVSLHYFDLYDNFKDKNTKNQLYFILRNIFIRSWHKISLGFFLSPIIHLTEWLNLKNVIVWDNTFDYDAYLLSNIKDNFFYIGYFQSEKYFSDYKNEIKLKFNIKPKYQQKFKQDKKYLFQNKCIVVHLRYGDYLTYGEEKHGGPNLVLPKSYYTKCLSLIEDISKYTVIFVSDDIILTQKEFGTKENYFFESNDEITDFQILLHANILIIANSTFSWWAAWLNSNEDKLVYAPKYFLGFKVNKFYPAGIKVDSWNWINVKD